ncbi:competence type IV pilus assembly protein ComGB [Aquibacillus salsiterrae]|uniref:Type II secretion system F family protein n=1 Tax=Aquibacillus salsiterrae TaxID=2950439 RepID=A0A9X4ADI6_9BACI|nr:competence type IV pilus assembly protein ComGB [Aquibacillus salsiterrae]MDC3415507.1 type II secretion system F family protein [Aquibacillus salsiterrae]
MHTAILTKRFLTDSKPKLSQIQQMEFLKKLARLIEGGYPLLDALEMLGWDNKWKPHVQVISETLKNGQRLDVALENAKFHKTVISFMFFAMADGDIPSALNHCCLMLNQQITLGNKLKVTTRYPLLLFLFFLTLLLFIKTSVYPSFLQLFESTADTLQITMVAITSIDILFKTSIFLIVFVAILLTGWLLIRKKIPIPTLVSFYNRVPIIRSVIIVNNSFLFALHLSSLLKTGISLRESLSILNRQAHLPIISYNTYILVNQLERGHSIPQALKNCSLLSPQFTAIFTKNSSNEALAKDLTIFAEFLIESMEAKIKRLINYVQPVFFIIIGVLIILVYLSLMLPMFQLINHL